MSTALRAMGVRVEQPSETEFLVVSTGRLTPADAPLFLGNAGTATRFITAAVATQHGRFVVDGDEHMRKRPIKPLVAALARLGVAASAPSGCPPVTIDATGDFAADSVEIDGGLSSQYVSAILMAAACLPRPFDLRLAGKDIGAKGYIDITLAVMRAFGARFEVPELGHWRLLGGGYEACDFAIEPDASAATYLWAAERMSGGQIDLGVDPLAMSQPDAKAWQVIQTWPRMPAVIDGSQMQDAIPTLAVLAAFNKTPVRFVGIANLRVKECDRTAACRAELNKIKPGLAAEQGDDLLVYGDPSLKGQARSAQIFTYADHRIAMAFALAGIFMPGLTILDPGCVAKTYPHYWRDMASLGLGVDTAMA
jgi:3-phosphoshikimate 1-carboxyvinyltransferase